MKKKNDKQIRTFIYLKFNLCPICNDVHQRQIYLVIKFETRIELWTMLLKLEINYHMHIYICSVLKIKFFCLKFNNKTKIKNPDVFFAETNFSVWFKSIVKVSPVDLAVHIFPHISAFCVWQDHWTLCHNIRKLPVLNHTTHQISWHKLIVLYECWFSDRHLSTCVYVEK